MTCRSKRADSVGKRSSSRPSPATISSRRIPTATTQASGWMTCCRSITTSRTGRPSTTSSRSHLDAGRRYPIKVDEQRRAIRCGSRGRRQRPRRTRRCGRRSARAIDYYFIYGPELDQVIAGYRTLTGQATLLPRVGVRASGSRRTSTTRRPRCSKTLAEFRRRADPDRQHRPGLAVLADRSMGRPRVRSRRAIPDPDAMIKAIHDSHARLHDLRLGQVLSGDGELQGDATRSTRSIRRRSKDRTRDWLNREYAFYDVFNAPRAEAVLGSGEPRAVQPRRRRLVDGRDRAGSRPAVAADARVAAPQHRSDGDRHGVAGHERVPAR